MIQVCDSGVRCVCDAGVGPHLPQHGQPRHLHAAALSVPRDPASPEATQELLESHRQHGGAVSRPTDRRRTADGLPTDH